MRELENYKYLGLLESGTIKQALIKFLKNEKRVSQMNGKISLKTHQRNKYLGYPRHKLQRTILKMDKRGTQTNGSEYKKVDEDSQGFISERWHKLYVSRKERERIPTSIEDSVNVSSRTRRLHIKEQRKNTYTAINSTGIISTNRRKIRKQIYE